MLHGVKHVRYELERSELSVHFTGAGCIILVDGAATIFGAPLKRNVRYNFSLCGVPVVCTSACLVHVEGEFTAVVGLLNSAVDDVHAVLDLARVEASMKTNVPHEECLRGPCVLVVGDQNTGKNSLCCTLVNLAISGQKYGVAFVDADVDQQSITFNGSIATVFVENYIPVDEGFNTMMPLTFFFGDRSVTTCTRKRYLDLCVTTAQAITSVFMAKPQYALGGVIVNTVGWRAELGRDIILDLLSVFSITHVVLCGSDSDIADYVRKAAIGRSLTFLSYPKQPRMFVREPSQLSELRTRQLVSYFQGTLRTPLSSYRGVASVKDVHFVDALTLKMLSSEEVASLSLAAVSWADSLETVGEANIAGFIVLLEVGKKFFSFLSPAAGTLPKPFLLVSSIIKLPGCRVPPFSAT